MQTAGESLLGGVQGQRAKGGRPLPTSRLTRRSERRRAPRLAKGQEPRGHPSAEIGRRGGSGRRPSAAPIRSDTGVHRAARRPLLDLRCAPPPPLLAVHRLDPPPLDVDPRHPNPLRPSTRERGEQSLLLRVEAKARRAWNGAHRRVPPPSPGGWRGQQTPASAHRPPQARGGPWVRFIRPHSPRSLRRLPPPSSLLPRRLSPPLAAWAPNPPVGVRASRYSGGPMSTTFPAPILKAAAENTRAIVSIALEHGAGASSVVVWDGGSRRRTGSASRRPSSSSSTRRSERRSWPPSSGSAPVTSSS